MKRAKYTTGYHAEYSLADKFIEILEQKGMTEKQLADLLEVEESVINGLLEAADKFTVFMAALMAEKLGFELEIKFNPIDPED